jgi:hypothetical protein
MALFSDQAEMRVAWLNGNAQFPIPKDYIGDWKSDFWLLEGPQNGNARGTINVQMNFSETSAYDKAVLDVSKYELVKKVLNTIEAVT